MPELNYTVDDVLTGEKQPWDKKVPSFTNEYEQGFSGGRTLDQIRQLGAGIRRLSVSPGESIQDAINKLNEIGGGIVELRNGTHKQTSNIDLFSNIYILGENAEACILDFVNNASSLRIIGTNPYTTGTVTVTNNSATVTGSSTLWSSNVTAGQDILLDGIWYPIAVVGSDTSITLGLAFGGKDLSGATYTIATKVNDTKVENLTVKNALNAIQAQYSNETVFRDLTLQTSVVGLKIDDSSQAQLEQCDAIANNSSYIFTNTHFTKLGEMGSVNSQVGVGFTFNTVTNSQITAAFSLNSATDGASFTSCSNMIVGGVFTESGEQGVEFVSGNSNIVLGPSRMTGNASDGVKLTATSDNIRIIDSNLSDNGGYGVNIANANCNETIISHSDFDTNTSGAVNDLGTDTMIIGNTPDSVNRDVFLKNDGDVGTGVYDFGGATSFEIPNSATPTVDAAGEIAIDTTITDHTGLIKYHDGVEELSVVGMPTANLSTTDGDVVKYNATNNEFEMGSVAPTQILQSYTAGENIASKDAVYVVSVQSGAGIGFDQVSGGEGSATSFSVLYTVAANSNRMLVFCLLHRDGTPAPTYNGVALTLLNTRVYTANGAWNLAIYSLVAPATGANTFAATGLSSFGGYYAYSIYSFYNVEQSTPTTKLENGGGTAFSSAITPSTPGGRIVGFSVRSTLQGTSYTNMNNRSLNDDTASFFFLSGESGNLDTNPPVSTTQSAIGGTDAFWDSQQVVLNPVNVFVDRIKIADASAAGTADAFIGFANAAITSGASGSVVIAGEVTGLSGLSTGGQYYLSDTAGAISTSAGTVTRKVGIGTSATTLNITNIW